MVTREAHAQDQSGEARQFPEEPFRGKSPSSFSSRASPPNSKQSQTPTEAEKVEKWMKDQAEVVTTPRPVVSLDPASQAHALSTIELILATATNAFLMHESSKGRLNPEITTHYAQGWTNNGLPPITDLLYDVRTQYNIVLSHGYTINFSSLCNTFPTVRATAMQAWSAIIGDVCHRVLCLSDDTIIKHLHALPQVLKMLRAPATAHVMVRGLQMKVLAKIEARATAGVPVFAGGVPSGANGLSHRQVDSDEDVFGGAVVDGPGPTVRKGDRGRRPLDVRSFFLLLPVGVGGGLRCVRVGRVLAPSMMAKRRSFFFFLLF